MQTLLLNGTWNMEAEEEKYSCRVMIPGSVLSGLMKEEKIENPFWGMNEYRTRELFRDEYSFCRSFEVYPDFLERESIELVCEGLDTLADIYINEQLISSVDNMHRTWRFPVKEYLNHGKNTIRIIFHSVLKYIEEYSYRENRHVNYTASGAMYGNHLIRKPHSMFGWDWGPQLVDAGIFRDIYLQAWNGSRISDIAIRQQHEKECVRLSVKVLFANHDKELKEPSERKLMCNLREKETGKIAACQNISVESEAADMLLTIQNPKLWWPNGYGEQPLYELEIILSDKNETELEKHYKTIGLRTLTVSRESDCYGQEFAFCVNGLKIFAMGGNYIPEDCVYSHITSEKQEYLLSSMKKAHYNCVRIWGGGYYPGDNFYELCDRMGFIVWQDLMYACNVYDVTDEFAANCRQEVLDNLKRIHHHPSLGLICGNNEIESAWSHWPDFQTESMYLRADYIRLFEEILPKAVKEAAPDTFFWPSSPSSGGCFASPDDENQGDSHYWDVWHGQKPFTDYKKYYFRFCSEFGFQAFPGMKTVAAFAEEKDWNIFSRVMESHQKNDAANGKMLYYLSENFKYPSKFDDLLYVSQILQGCAIQYGVEHWRRNRGRCMGTLYWQVNDNWPAPSWSSIDYFGRWKALHYFACRFYAPVASSMLCEEDTVRLFVVNETQKKQTYTATISVKTMDFRTIAASTSNGSTEPFSSSCALSFDLKEIKEYADMLSLPKEVRKFEEQTFLEGTILLEDGTVLQSIETLLPYKYMNLPVPQIYISVKEEEQEYTISLMSDCFAAFVELDFDDADVIFSDNYFMLTDSEPKVITIRKKEIMNGVFSDAEDLRNRIKVRTLANL